jgi:hypothetical protein
MRIAPSPTPAGPLSLRFKLLRCLHVFHFEEFDASLHVQEMSNYVAAVAGYDKVVLINVCITLY